MEDSDDDRILPNFDEGSSSGRKKKQLTGSLSTENDIDLETRTDSENDSNSSETDSSDSSDSDAEYECTICDKIFSGYLSLKQHKKGSKHKKALVKKKKMKKLLNKDDDEEKEGGEYLIEEPFAVCRTCTKQFSGPESYSLHLKSKAHKQKKLEASILEKVKERGEINLDKLKELYIQRKSALGKTRQILGKDKLEAEEGQQEFDGGDYECKTCEKAFSGLIPFTQHLVSKTHAKQIEKEELMRKVIPSTSDNGSNTNDVSVLDVEDDILVCKACSMSFSGPQNAILHLKSQKHKKTMEKYKRKLEKKKNKKTEVKEIKESSSISKPFEYVIQKGEELEDSSSEESDEPTSSSSKRYEAEKPTSKEKLSEVNTPEEVMNENMQLYKKAMKSFLKHKDSEQYH